MQIKDITRKLKKYFDKNAFILWIKIVKQARRDNEYRKNLDLWLFGEKSTIHFRDKLALLFSKDKEFSEKLSWFNAWTSIDMFAHQIKKHET